MKMARVLKNTVCVCFTLAFLLLILPHDAKAIDARSAKKVITLVTPKPISHPSGEYLHLIYSEAFSRMGIQFVYKQLPAARASVLSDSGVVDGELSRVYSYNDVHPNLIRVEEPHWTSEFIAIANDPTIQLTGWKSLLDTDYKVNYRLGIKGCEENLPKVVSPDRLEGVNSPASGLRKVLAGRADIFIGTTMDVLPVLNAEEFKNSELREVGIMEQFTAHAFLHKKHKDLVPKLSETLRQLKREGIFEQFKETVNLHEYLNDD